MVFTFVSTVILFDQDSKSFFLKKVKAKPTSNSNPAAVVQKKGKILA